MLQCTVQGGVCSGGGGGVPGPGGGVGGGGGCLPGPGGCAWSRGGVCSRGVCAWSGGWVVLLPGGGGIPACTEVDTPPPVDRHTLVKILPWPNFVAAR